MIELIPAIDIIDGKCVRLTQGDYAQKKIYADNPADVAKHFEEAGFKRLHLVDLDGARSKRLANIGVLQQIARETNLIIDYGGGIKSQDNIQQAFDSGASMVSIGSIAISQPELFRQWTKLFGPEKIILCADVKNGHIAINGWAEDTGIDLFPFIQENIKNGINNILCSDISKDGTLQGPALPLYRQIMEAFPTLHLIASGGIASNEDIEALEKAGIPAAVFGKAYYEGKIDINKLKLK